MTTEEAKRNAMPPSIKDKSLLAGKLDSPTIKEWKRRQGLAVRLHMESLRQRWDLIEKATKAGLLGWERDPLHYRAGKGYCACPGGTVQAHNDRFDQTLRRVDDGR